MSLIITLIIFIIIYNVRKKEGSKRNTFNNIVYSILKNNLNISKNDFYEYTNSKFYNYLYNSNKKNISINDNFENLIIQNFNAYKREKRS